MPKLVLTSVSVSGAEMLRLLGLVNLSLASELLLVETGCSSDADELPNERFIPSVDEDPVEKVGRWVGREPDAVGGYEVRDDDDDES